VTPCCTKPLHRLTDRLEHESHCALRGELSLIVALAAEELARPGSRSTALLREFHARAGRLLDTVKTHFQREETRLFPAVRLVEDGLIRGIGRLGPLLLDLRRDHAVIRARLDEVRELTDNAAAEGACPLVEMLYDSLRALANDLERHLDDEERTLFPSVVATVAHVATASA
jgi:iron-sulfur cluster repair protein YtfE (RIC family)